MDARQDTLDQLQAQIVELRASRERLVLAADIDRQRLERDLHEGVQQHLVALAVNVQLVESLLESAPGEAKKVLEEMGRDVQQALNEAAQLAERIYSPLLALGGFAAALRAAAVSAGIPASVEVSAGSVYPPEVVHTVYSYWLDALQHRRGETRPAIVVREETGALTFEIVRDAGLDSVHDRVEALGGHVSVESQPGDCVRVRGSLPLSG